MRSLTYRNPCQYTDLAKTFSHAFAHHQRDFQGSTYVGIHEGDGHGDRGTVGKDEVGVLPELLDDAEDVVPTTAVETGRVIPELIDDLVHLEGGSDGLDEDGGTDGTAGHADVVLSQVDGVVPEAGFEMGLHLGEVEVRTETPLHGLEGIVEEVETEVEERSGHGLAIDSDVLLKKVPPTGADDEGGESAVAAELVFLGALLEVNLATVGVVQVDLTVEHVLPGGSAGVCESGELAEVTITPSYRKLPVR